MNLDGFAAVPSGTGSLTELEIPFGDEPVVYAIGPASCAVPAFRRRSASSGSASGASLDAALRAGSRARAHGCPGPGDARAHARDARRALCARAWRRPVHAGRPPLGDGDILHQPGIVQALEALADEGAASVYRGSIAESLSDRRDRAHRDDLESYRAVWRDPTLVPYAGRRVVTRAGLSGVPELLPGPRLGS